MYTYNSVTGFKSKYSFSLGSVFSRLVNCQTVELYTGDQPCSWGLSLASVTEDPGSWISWMGMCDLNWYYAPCVIHTKFFSPTQSVILLQVLFFGVAYCLFLFVLCFIVLISAYHKFDHINQLEIICVGTVALANCHLILWSDIVVVFLVLCSLNWLLIINKITWKCGSLTHLIFFFFLSPSCSCFLIQE